MSEEEIIKQLKEACILDENCYEVDCLYEKDLIAIRGLYDLYNKEKEEKQLMEAEFNRLEDLEDDREQLKILLKEEKEKNQKILSDNIETFQKLFAEEISKIYISKDKIREKIKHYEELLRDYIEKYDATNDGIEGMINVLKELLED